MSKKKKDIEEELIQEADEEIENIDDNRIAELEGQLKRALADYKNLEKRVEEKRQEWVLTSNRILIERLIPVLDDLFLAQKHIQDDGLNMSIQKFQDVLAEEGVEVIKTKDQNFDPNTMECVSVQEGDKDKILEEVRRGYKMNENVIRPAQVIVGGPKE